MGSYILALDQGTTSSRGIIFDRSGREVAKVQQPFTQSYPRPGWVEHDPREIRDTQLATAREVIQRARIQPSEIAAIGIANQRETAVFWDRKTGEPLGPAIVWQDRRTAGICRRLTDDGLEEEIHARTGLLLDPYFSGTKIAWFLENVPGMREKARSGSACFGTVDSWLLRCLTGRHVTDPSNASRTLLYNIHRGAWDPELLAALDIPAAMLPEVFPSSGRFGVTDRQTLGAEIPVCGCLGDQQAALLGQACLSPGMVKVTYGTGCFALMCTGGKVVESRNRLISTVAWDLGRGPEYALEGSVFVGGAVVQWLRDEMHLVASAAETEQRARSVPDTGGVYFVPAFVGLGAPHWDPEARGAVLGMTRGTRPEHVIRAALESVAFQTRDLIEAMQKDAGADAAAGIRVDGGASMNGLLMQFQSDILGAPLVRPLSPETTALGAAFAAGLSAGFWRDREELTRIWQADARFEPSMRAEERTALLAGWRRALAAARSFGCPPSASPQ
jgi:glycerol kinase